MPLLFVIERTGCFAISDMPTFDIVSSANEAQGVGAVQVPLAYHLGVRLGLWLAHPIILTQYMSLGLDDLCRMLLVICYTSAELVLY